MKNIAATALLLLACSCSSLPEKKILGDKDYQTWQRDLSLRMQREPENLALVQQMKEIALINEDFATALRSAKTLQEKSYGQAKELAFSEIQILRYAWQLDECLKKIDEYVIKNPTDPESKSLALQRPVIERSKTLPPPLPISPFRKNAHAEFTYAQVMQAPEMIFLKNNNKDEFSDLRNGNIVPDDVWLKPTKRMPLIDDLFDADVLHYPVHEQNKNNTELPLPYVQYSAGAVDFFHADLTTERLDFLKSQNCTLPAFSPWLDFFVVSCTIAGQADLFLYTKVDGAWKESQNKLPLNTQFDEISPRISSDGRFLFFASNGLPGYGAFDYYYSPIEYAQECSATGCRQVTKFGNPVNFGPQINTYHNEMYPMQISPFAKGIYVSAQGKNGLLAKSPSPAATPKISETLSYRFIAYSGKATPPRSVTITPLRGDARRALIVTTGQKADWIRLISGAEYAAVFAARPGVELRYRIKVPSPAQNGGANFAIERFSFEADAETVMVKDYAENAASVSKAVQLEMDKIARTLKDNPQLHALVEGHTDNVGGEAYNLGLSEKRAEAVKKQLIALGIPAFRISTRGWGELRPLNANVTKDERATNRRVEIQLVPQ